MSDYQKQYYAKNRDKIIARVRAWREAYPERVLRNNLKKRKVTLEQYNEAFLQQNGVCAICGLPEEQDRNLSADHNHSTGKFRGLLCNRCNPALGAFKDNSELLYKAIAYLRQHEDSNS